jgi:poly-gamma-glutamate capsule biosynthesis protein CapA/YwtB (metallophosphatase superfamily)
MLRPRTFLLVSIAAVFVGVCLTLAVIHEAGSVLAAPQEPQGQALTPQQAQEAQAREARDKTRFDTNVEDGFTVASVGDIIIAHPSTPYPENKPVAAILQAADVAMGNFEESIVDYRNYKVPQNIISHYWALNAEPAVAKDLKAMGLDMVGRANNHQSDWGIDGARETNRWLDEAGIVHAGDGETRGLAREAQFYDTPKGRVGLISISSSISDPQQIAIDGKGNLPPRYGLNPLRVIRFTIVTAEQMKALRSIRDAYPRSGKGVAASSISAPVFVFPYTETENELYLFGTWYRIGDKPGFSYKMDPLDEREILQSIRRAKHNCDFLIVTIHAHEAPADFLTQISRAAIDAGADEWVGTGPHRLLGIEIYKNRPIFHSLGDLFFEINLATQPASAEEIESTGLDPAQIDDATFAANFWDRMPPQGIHESAIVVSKFDRNQLSEIRIHPIDLGWERRPADRGRPRIASPEMAQRILRKQQKDSAPYGTTVTIEGNVGVIRPVRSN